MLEEAPCIAGTHRLESSAQGFQQGFSGARPGLTHKSLELGEGLFYWVEVRRVGWQVEKLAASSFDELSDPRALVGGEVVHHHDLSRLQRGSQNPLHVGLKDHLRGRPFHRQRRSHPRKGHAREQRDVGSPITRRLEAHSLAPTRPAVDWRERGVVRALVHEHEAPPVYSPADQNAPSRPQELVSLARVHTPSFGLKPIFLKSLERVDSLTEIPTTSLRKRHLSLRVAAGRSSTSASRSFLALSSSLALEPGCFFGASGLPSRRAAA